jgi:hypothetical protein
MGSVNGVSGANGLEFLHEQGAKVKVFADQRTGDADSIRGSGDKFDKLAKEARGQAGEEYYKNLSQAFRNDAEAVSHFAEKLNSEGDCLIGAKTADEGLRCEFPFDALRAAANSHERLVKALKSDPK